MQSEKDRTVSNDATAAQITVSELMTSSRLVLSTHIQLTDSAGLSMVRTSCGTEGFKNIKKSTPVAAQTAGISAASVSVCLYSTGVPQKH